MMKMSKDKQTDNIIVKDEQTTEPDEGKGLGSAGNPEYSSEDESPVSVEDLAKLLMGMDPSKLKLAVQMVSALANSNAQIPDLGEIDSSMDTNMLKILQSDIKSVASITKLGANGKSATNKCTPKR